MASEELGTEISMDAENLYKEEMFTDRRVGTIQRLTRVDADGNPVDGVEAIFVGQTQLMTRAGPLPLSFEIPAATLTEAAAKFGDGANAAMEETVQRLEEMRREQSSSIIVPEGTPGAGGGIPGGGQIKMP
ncbi:MAG: hypothetical protein ACE5G3_04710 [Gammaproteobacteria bacterium]